MKASLALSSLIIVIALSGCAYDEAMDRGDAWARSGDWDRALEAYHQANRIDPDDPEAIDAMAQSRVMIVGQHVAGARRSLAAGDYEDAFELTFEAREVLEESEDVRLVLEAITSKIVDEASGLIAAGHYSEGLEYLSLLEAHRPELKESLERDVRQAELAWAARLSRLAAENEADGDIGGALVHVAMAASLSGEAEDAKARDRLRQMLVRDNAYRLTFSVEGERARAAQITSNINGLLARGGRALRITREPAEPGLALVATISKGTCGQSRRSKVANHRYVSGTRQVANSDWVRKRDELADLERRLLVAEQKADDELEELEEAEEDLERAEKKEGEDLQRPRGKVEDRRRDVREARRAMRRLREEVLRVHDRLAREEPFDTEDVYSDFSYEIVSAVRTCQVTWSGSMRDVGGEKGAPFGSVQAARTSDDTHPAHVQFGISEDPLRFPKSDEALVSEADKAISEAVFGLVVERFTRHRDALLERSRALSASDPSESARLLVVSYLLEPDNGLSGAGLQLKQRFKMTDPFVLLKKGL